jgi:hypothetical protein
LEKQIAISTFTDAFCGQIPVQISSNGFVGYWQKVRKRNLILNQLRSWLGIKPLKSPNCIYLNFSLRHFSILGIGFEFLGAILPENKIFSIN